LEDQRPGDKRKDQKEQQNATGDPTGLLENTKKVGDEKSRMQKSDVDPSKSEIFLTQKP
jgi:hypothetical protein